MVHTRLFGISDEARRLGYDLNIQDAGGYANVDKQVTQLSALVVQKVKAILLDPADPTAFNGAVRQVKDAHIPIIGAGTPLVASNVSADGAVSSSHCNIGRELAKGAKALLPKGGSIAVLAGPPGAFWSSERLRCFNPLLGVQLRSLPSKQVSRTLLRLCRLRTISYSDFQILISCTALTIPTVSGSRAQFKAPESVGK